MCLTFAWETVELVCQINSTRAFWHFRAKTDAFSVITTTKCLLSSRAAAEHEAVRESARLSRPE